MMRIIAICLFALITIPAIVTAETAIDNESVIITVKASSSDVKNCRTEAQKYPMTKRLARVMAAFEASKHFHATDVTIGPVKSETSKNEFDKTQVIELSVACSKKPDVRLDTETFKVFRTTLLQKDPSEEEEQLMCWYEIKDGIIYIKTPDIARLIHPTVKVSDDISAVTFDEDFFENGKAMIPILCGTQLSKLRFTIWGSEGSRLQELTLFVE